MTQPPPPGNAAAVPFPEELIMQIAQETGYSPERVRADIAATGASTKEQLYPNFYGGHGIQPQQAVVPVESQPPIAPGAYGPAASEPPPVAAAPGAPVPLPAEGAPAPVAPAPMEGIPPEIAAAMHQQMAPKGIRPRRR